MSASSANPSAIPWSPGWPIGSYDLHARLGRSALTTSWLAADRRSGAPVVLALPRVPPATRAARAAWLDGARSAMRIAHPMLATVLDVGVHEGWPYIVYDRGSAQTLREWVAIHGEPSHVDVARWLGDVLQGLAYAHDAGIAHRDLQRDCVLVGDRRAMLVGLGAAGVAGDADALALDARREQRDAAERDVWCAGVLMHTLLAGRDALDEPDIAAVVERLAAHGGERVRLPRVTPQPLSNALRAITDRATASHARLRYRNPRTLREALDGWREASERVDAGPVARLLERMTSVGHLPALPGSDARATQLARMERGRTQELAELVLQDIGLGVELLRQVNGMQARDRRASGSGPVLTVRRAIAMLGLSGVAQAASALRPWPGPLEGADVEALRELIGRVRLAARVAVSIRPPGYDPEVVFVVALLQNLGRLVLQYHFADAASQMRELMREADARRDVEPDVAGLSEDEASSAVLGAEVQTFATAAGRYLGFDDAVLHLMRRLNPETAVRAADSDDDLIRATASAANEVVDTLSLPEPRRDAAIERIARRYARTLGVSAGDLRDALRQPAGMPVLLEDLVTQAGALR